MPVSYLSKMRVVKEPTEKAFEAWADLKIAELIAFWDRKGYTLEQRKMIISSKELTELAELAELTWA